MSIEAALTIILMVAIIGGTVIIVRSCRKLPTAEVDPERVRRFVARGRHLRQQQGW